MLTRACFIIASAAVERNRCCGSEVHHRVRPAFADSMSRWNGMSTWLHVIEPCLCVARPATAGGPHRSPWCNPARTKDVELNEQSQTEGATMISQEALGPGHLIRLTSISCKAGYTARNATCLHASGYPAERSHTVSRKTGGYYNNSGQTQGPPLLSLVAYVCLA